MNLDGVFPEIVADYEAHDKTCKSLNEFWFGRKGGYTDWGSIADCDKCEATFYIEAFVWSDELDDMVYLCECCRR